MYEKILKHEGCVDGLRRIVICAVICGFLLIVIAYDTHGEYHISLCVSHNPNKDHIRDVSCLTRGIL